MSDQTAPERIWLQTAGSYAEAHEATIGTDTGVTWCDMQQDDGDQEYIRADLGSFYQEKDIDALMACREAAKTAEAWLDRWAAHVGNCPGGGLCSCGLEVARHELRNALFDTREQS